MGVNGRLPTFTEGSSGLANATAAKAALLAAMTAARGVNSSLTNILAAVEDGNTLGASTFAAVYATADQRAAYRAAMIDFVRNNKIAAALVANSDAASFAQNAVIAGLGGTAAISNTENLAIYTVADAVLGGIDSLSVALSDGDITAIHSAAASSLTAFTSGGSLADIAAAKTALEDALKGARTSGAATLTALLGVVDDGDTLGASNFAAIFTDAAERAAYRAGIKQGMINFVRKNKIASELVANSDAASFAQNAVIAGLGGIPGISKTVADAKAEVAAQSSAGIALTDVVTAINGMSADTSTVSGALAAKFAPNMTGNTGYVIAPTTAGNNVAFDTVSPAATSALRTALDLVYAKTADLKSYGLTSLDCLDADKKVKITANGAPSSAGTEVSTAESGLDKDVATLRANGFVDTANNTQQPNYDHTTGSLLAFTEAKKAINAFELSAVDRKTRK